MEADNLNEIVTDMREQVIDDLIDTYMPPKTMPISGTPKVSMPQ